MKKLPALLMAGILALSMTACGGSQAPADNQGSADTKGAEGETTAAAEEEEITCDMLVWSPAEDQSEEFGNWLQTQCEAFAAEHPNWHITFSYGICPEGESDNDAGIDFSGEKATAVTDYLVDLVANENFKVDVDGSGIAGIRDGSIKAMFSGSWDYQAVKDALGENFGAAQLPCYTLDGKEVQMYSFAGTKALAVSSKTEYPQVAVALAKYLGGVEAQKSHYETRNIIPCNTELLSDPSMDSDLLVKAQNDTVANTSIIQPFVAGMANYWTPTDNFGKSLRNGEVTHDNAADATEAWNKNMNTSVVE